MCVREKLKILLERLAFPTMYDAPVVMARQDALCNIFRSDSEKDEKKMAKLNIYILARS